MGKERIFLYKFLSRRIYRKAIIIWHFTRDFIVALSFTLNGKITHEGSERSGLDLHHGEETHL